MGLTLAEKVWKSHLVRKGENGEPDLLYIDLHLVHEVTSPQAFDGLRLADRRPWRLAANLAVADHNVPTTDRSQGIAAPISTSSRRSPTRCRARRWRRCGATATSSASPSTR